MAIAVLLVLIGTILVGLALLLPYVRHTPRGNAAPAYDLTLLALGALLIGIGCLVGPTAIH